MSQPAEQLPIPSEPEERRWLGVVKDLPDPEYRAAPGINKSGLDDIHVSPRTYVTKKHNPKPQTPAMVFGSAFHCLVLEPERFPQVYVQDKFSGSQSKEAKAWRAEQELAGKLCINTKSDDDKGIWGASDWDKLHRMRDSVMIHPTASIIIESSEMREVCYWWVDPTTRKLCKARADGYSSAHRLLSDVKTSSDATFGGFQHSVNDYRYHVQTAWYLDGGAQAGLDVGANRFVFIVAEKEPPYEVACYKLSPEWVQMGREIYLRDLEVFKQCHDSGEWPGLGWREDFGIRDLDVPGYARYHKIS